MPTPQQPIESVSPITLARGRAITKLAVHALGCVAGLLVGTTASAQDYKSRVVAGWTVAASEDGQGCFLTKVYEHVGGTTLLLGLDLDGTNHVSVLNANWSIKPKEQLSLDFSLSKGGYVKHFAVGMKSDGKQGFVTSFEAKFPAYFASSTFLNISRGDVPVERLSLDGSGAAVAELRKCVDAQREKPAGKAASKAPSDDIPKDPFARHPAPDAKN